MKLENNSKWTNLYLVFVFVVLYAPIFYLIFYSFNSAGSMNGFESFTLDHYKAVLADTRLIGIVLDTLILALLSSLIATMIGTLGAIMIHYIRSNRRKQVLLGFNNIFDGIARRYHRCQPFNSLYSGWIQTRLYVGITCAHRV